MSELPIGWVEVSLHALLKDLLTGRRPKGGVRGITQGLLSLGGEHISISGKIDLNTPRYIPEDFAKTLTNVRVLPYDILVVKDGATTGKVALADNCFENIEAYINEHLFLCRPHELLDSRFIYYYLHSELGKSAILSDFRGAAQGGISRQFADKVIVPLPPLNEQRRIVAKLDRLFARSRCAREELGRVSGLVQRYKQAVLTAAFRGDLTADWRERQNKNDDWEDEDTTVEKLIDGIDAGINIKCEERPPEPHEFGLVKISAVTWGVYDDSKSKTIPPNQSVPESTRIREGDFLISRANTLELVGACVIVECVSRPVFLSDKVLRVLVREPYKKWLLYWLRSNNGRNQIEQLASGNQLSMRNLTQANLKAITLKLPDEDEINEIINRIEKLFKAIDLIEQEHQQASKLLDRLEQATLSKAFRGELVPQDPNDEPAAVLLERIQSDRQGQPKGKAIKSKQSHR